MLPTMMPPFEHLILLRRGWHGYLPAERVALLSRQQCRGQRSAAICSLVLAITEKLGRSRKDDHARPGLLHRSQHHESARRARTVSGGWHDGPR